MRIKSFAAAIGVAAFVWGCSGMSEDVAKPVTMERLDLAVEDYSRGVPVSADHEAAVRVLGRAFGADSASDFLEAYAGSRAVKMFMPDIRSRLHGLDSVESELGSVRRGMGEWLPDVAFPARVYGVVIPYNQSVILADTVAFVGLNHYLGADYPGYEAFDLYRRVLKEPDRIVPDLTEAIVRSAYPYEDGLDATVLSRMIYEGAIVNAMIKSDPQLTLSRALGWSGEQLRWAEVNERRSWQQLIASDLLFSTNPADAARLVNPAPATAVINPSAPGQLGRYIGYRIVEKWLESHHGASPKTLLKPIFYNSRDTLIESAYAP